MTEGEAIDWLSRLLIEAMVIGAPPILAAVAIGMLIAILQAATQINDSATAFAPKLLVVVVTLTVSGEFMLRRVSDFAARAITSAATIHR